MTTPDDIPPDASDGEGDTCDVQAEARLITRYAAIDDVPLARECAGAAAAVRRDTDRRDIADLLERAAIALTRRPATPQPGTVTVQEYEGNPHWPKEPAR